MSAKPNRHLHPTALLRLITLVLLILTLGACQSAPPAAPEAATDPETPVKSPVDPRDYLAFELPNRLKVLVISDPEADKAAASLSVAVGSGADPQDRQGLAHFLEHMLFLGTEKYPEAGAYQRYINAHGGSHNAFTSFDRTNYFFEINPPQLAPALDQFAQFFIAPTFDSAYVEREKHAVHSEYQSKIRDDSRLQREVLKALANPNHAFSQFAVGSLQTLENTPERPLREDLLDFYQQYYSANLMTLVVLGKAPVEALQQMVAETFAGIEDRQRSAPQFTAPLFDPQQLPLHITTRPVKDLHQVIYHFPIPGTRTYYQRKPVHYLSNLLGHEGEGSLLSYLKKRGWAENLRAGTGLDTGEQATLSVSIGLTENGLEHTDDITEALFGYIALIRQQGVEKWRYEEQARLAELSFRYQENGSNMHYVTRLANLLQDVPAADVLQAPYLMSDFDADLITRYLAALRPDNMILMEVGKSLPVDARTPYFNAPYARQPLSTREQQIGHSPQANAQLKLPVPNPFIPSQLQLVAPPQAADERPHQITGLPGIRLWHAVDTSFESPRADFFFTLRTPLANQSATQVALLALFSKTLNEQLNEFSYPATLAGLNYHLYPHVRGISVRLSGFDDKQEVLLEEILRSLTAPEISTALFQRQKEELRREWQNALQQTPYRQSLKQTATRLTLPAWSERQLIEALEPLTAQDLQAFSVEFLKALDVELLANGNLTAGRAAQMAQRVARQLETVDDKVSVKRPRIARLPARQPQLLPVPVDHSDHAVTLYLQGNNKTIEERARFTLLNQVLSTPFYHELRTEQQLGYIVFSSPMNLMEVPALALTVQSPHATPAQILDAMDTFIEDAEARLAALDSKILATHKAALTSRIMQQDTQLNQRSLRYWYEIDRENYRFDTREQLVRAIEAIEKNALIAGYRETFIDQPRQLAVVASSLSNPLPASDRYWHIISQDEVQHLNDGLFPR